MTDIPRIFDILDDDDYYMAILHALAVVPKADLRKVLRGIKPGGGVRTPNIDRDPPEKVARFLLDRHTPATILLCLGGLVEAIREGAWAEIRTGLLPNLDASSFPDIKIDFMGLLRHQNELAEEQVGPVRADLRALSGRRLCEEEAKVLLMVEWCFVNLQEEIQALVRIDPGQEPGVTPPEPPAQDVASDLDSTSPQAIPPKEGPLPSDDFSALDRLLLRAAVDSVGGVEGSLTPEETVDLIEEVIHLNTTRTKTYFHRGYIHALIGDSGLSSGHEQNQERRAWEWAGRIIGFTRLDQRGRILDEYQENLDLAKAMSEGGHPGAAHGAMPRVIQALLDEGYFQDACALLKPPLVRQSCGYYIESLISRGRDLVRSRRVEEAKRVIGKARELLGHEFIATAVTPELRYECNRRWAQVMRAQGAFKEARALFTEMLAAGGPAPELRTDLALCMAKVHWLDDIALPVKNSENGALIQQLEQARSEAEAALAGGGLAPGAAYLLGISDLLHRGREAEALEHLERAYEMALYRDEVYTGSLFFNHLCLALSVGILLAMDETQFEKANELLHRALDDGRLTKLPLDLFKRTIEVIRASGHPACLRILQEFQQRCPDILEEHLRNPEFLEASPAILALLERRSQSEERTAKSRWNDLEALLTARLKAGDQRGAEACLARMEDLALSHERLTQSYLAVLEDPDRSGAILDDVDRLEARRVLHQMRRQSVEEGKVLLELARHALGSRQLGLAIEYLDEAEKYGVPESDLDLHRRWAADLADSIPKRPEDEPNKVMPISILLVGGNEIQARYDEPIREHFRRLDRQLRIEFIHPAWSSNWNADLDDVKRKLDSHDALVVMRFNRTQFGRHLRRMAGEHRKRWFACTGHGRDSLIRAISRAADVMRISAT